MTSDSHIAMWFIAALIIGTGVATCQPAHGHDPYTDWKQPSTGMSCCNETDCRPARSYLGNDGIHYVLVSGRWQPVPAHRVLSRPSPDLSSHVCASPLTDEIYCFVPGPGGT